MHLQPLSRTAAVAVLNQVLKWRADYLAHRLAEIDSGKKFARGPFCQIWNIPAEAALEAQCVATHFLVDGEVVCVRHPMNRQLCDIQVDDVLACVDQVLAA